MVLNSRSAREVAEDGRGLARAIGKTLGVLTQQVGEWEAVEAEEQVGMEAGGGGEGGEEGGLPGAWGGVRDYYFDDEMEGEDDMAGAEGYGYLL
jgi:hypothetical protein